MPIETANYIHQLDPTNPAAPDALADTDNHLRMIKQALKNNFPNLTGPVTGTTAQMNAFVPIGGIIIWNGNADTVPSGWGLCTGAAYAKLDGSGSLVSPNLTDKFVKGLNAAGTNSGTTGGAVTQSGTAAAGGSHGHVGSTDTQGGHSHGGLTGYTAISVAQMPNHAHLYQGTVVQANYGGGPSTSAAAPYAMYTSYEGGGQAHTHGIASDGAHAHNITISADGEHTHTVTVADGQPPYYTLAFIMKL